MTHTSPTFREMLEELGDLSAGLGIVLLPLFMLALPAVVLFVLPVAILLLVLAAPLAVLGALIAGPPYLVKRWLRRRGRRTGQADSPLRPRVPDLRPG